MKCVGTHRRDVALEASKYTPFTSIPVGLIALRGADYSRCDLIALVRVLPGHLNSRGLPMVESESAMPWRRTENCGAPASAIALPYRQDGMLRSVRRALASLLLSIALSSRGGRNHQGAQSRVTVP